MAGSSPATAADAESTGGVSTHREETVTGGDTAASSLPLTGLSEHDGFTVHTTPNEHNPTAITLDDKQLTGEDADVDAVVIPQNDSPQNDSNELDIAESCLKKVQEALESNARQRDQLALTRAGPTSLTTSSMGPAETGLRLRDLLARGKWLSSELRRVHPFSEMSEAFDTKGSVEGHRETPVASHQSTVASSRSAVDRLRTSRSTPGGEQNRQAALTNSLQDTCVTLLHVAALCVVARSLLSPVRSSRHH